MGSIPYLFYELMMHIECSLDKLNVSESLNKYPKSPRQQPSRGPNHGQLTGLGILLALRLRGIPSPLNSNKVK